MGGTGGAGGKADIHIRAATPDDDPAVLDLLAASMGWVPDELSARFFTWKHRENPFGPSPSWVAVDSDTGQVVGFRTMLRWRFEQNGEPIEAVRAVDTATHPDYQGHGIFTRLTRHALDELRAQNISFVFNTPNARSRPGYLKMGWHPVARLPVAIRPRSPLTLLHLLRARTPATKWSTPTTAAAPAPDVLLAGSGAGAADPATRTNGLRTIRTDEYLQWRYGFPELHYRALPAPDGPEAGIAIFRLRKRGPATEAAICELLVPDENKATTRHLLRQILKTTNATHATLIAPAHPTQGLLPLPKQGPTLVWRQAATEDEAPPPRDHWHLSLGDVELF